MNTLVGLSELPYANLVARHGLTASHWFLLEPIPDEARVLDVGCASGYVAAALGERGCTVYGLEPDPDLAAAARTHCEEVFTFDVEQGTDSLPSDLDAIVLGDVLEHLRDPWRVLDELVGHLRPGGLALISVPNVGHWRARWEIGRGRFPLESSGTFDRTHLRWFTVRSAQALATGAGLTVEQVRFTPAPLPLEPPLRAVLGGTDVAPPFPLGHLRWYLSRKLPRLFALQTVMACRRPGGPPLP